MSWIFYWNCCLSWNCPWIYLLDVLENCKKCSGLSWNAFEFHFENLMGTMESLAVKLCFRMKQIAFFDKGSHRFLSMFSNEKYIVCDSIIKVFLKTSNIFPLEQPRKEWHNKVKTLSQLQCHIKLFQQIQKFDFFKTLQKFY